MVLKGVFLYHFSSEFPCTWLGLHLDIIIKNPGMKREVGQTVSDKGKKEKYQLQEKEKKEANYLLSVIESCAVNCCNFVVLIYFTTWSRW